MPDPMTTPEREGRENLPALLPPEPVPLSRDIIKEIVMGEAAARPDAKTIRAAAEWLEFTARGERSCAESNRKIGTEIRSAGNRAYWERLAVASERKAERYEKVARWIVSQIGRSAPPRAGARDGG